MNSIIDAFNRSTSPFLSPHHRDWDMIAIAVYSPTHLRTLIKCYTKYWNTAMMQVNMILWLALLSLSCAIYHNIHRTCSTNTICSEMSLNTTLTYYLAVAQEKLLFILGAHQNIKSCYNHRSFLKRHTFKKFTHHTNTVLIPRQI